MSITLAIGLVQIDDDQDRLLYPVCLDKTGDVPIYTINQIHDVAIFSNADTQEYDDKPTDIMYRGQVYPIKYAYFKATDAVAIFDALVKGICK